MSTDALIAYAQADNTDLSPADLAAAIPVAIDAMYSARDAGRNMHEAGADAAVAVLKAVQEAHHA